MIECCPPHCKVIPSENMQSLPTRTVAPGSTNTLTAMFTLLFAVVTSDITTLELCQDDMNQCPTRPFPMLTRDPSPILILRLAFFLIFPITISARQDSGETKDEIFKSNKPLFKSSASSNDPPAKPGAFRRWPLKGAYSRRARAVPSPSATAIPELDGATTPPPAVNFARKADSQKCQTATVTPAEPGVFSG